MPAAAAHHGSIAAEIAVCHKAVGLAIRSDLETLELRGDAPWLDALLACSLGEMRVPPSGRVVTTGGAWCARTTDDAALVVGPPPAITRWRRVARHAIVTGSPLVAGDHPVVDRALSLVGPRTGELLLLAGLPPASPANSVHACTLADAPAVLIAETPGRALLLVPAHAAGRARAALGEVGPLVGLSLIGLEAVAHLAAARAGRR